MPHKIQISEEAHQDTLGAVDYYSTISAGLADRFEQELYRTYTKVAANPQHYKYLTKGKRKQYRCAKLKAFPFLVIYKIDKDAIIVMAVFNTYRKPVHGMP